jgi:hypothetical protein
MPASRAHLDHPVLRILRNRVVRTGIYTGVFLSVCFTVWVLVANRVPFLEPLAFARNTIAAGVLVLIACLPVMRFYRMPGEMLASALIGWSLLTLTFRLLCIKFVLLDAIYSVFQIFMMGSIVYLIVATLAWIGTIIRRARASHISHLNH